MTANTSKSLSYDHGASSSGLIGATLGDYFQQVADQCPEREALVSCHQNLRLTYADLSRLSNHLAASLLKLGIVEGDRVGIWSSNNWQWVVTQLATAKIGAILVNINPAYRSQELAYALQQSGVKLLVCQPGFKGDEYLKMLAEIAPQVVLGKSTASLALETIAVIGKTRQMPDALLDFQEMLGSGADFPLADLKAVSRGLQFDSPINIQYTSGTTGHPKGATLTHHNLLNNALASAQSMGLNQDSRFCVPMPFYHCGGMVLCTLTTLLSGGCLVIPSASFDAGLALLAVQKERCTHLAGVPTMFIAELEHPEFDSFDLSSLKGGFMAGAPCPVELMHKVCRLMHMKDVVIFYGQTEASPVITATPPECSLDKRAGTVGKVIPHLELKVVDTISGAIVERGVQGEVCARGYAVMPGYWENPQATSDSIDCFGWLHTGDLGEMSEDGYLQITGRKKDMIIRGGENIYPREIEEVLAQHQAVAQAYVFGVPDERLGEEVALWVQLKHDADCSLDEISVWLAARVAHFKVPRHIKQVGEFPMTVTGKVQKFAMRDIMIKELGLQPVSNVHSA